MVTASAVSGPAKTVQANSYCDYFIPALSSGAAKVEATCEGARALTNATISGAPTVVNLTLPNARPKLGPAYAELGGKVVRAAAPGSTVHVSVAVQDGGGYPLHYRWAVDPPTSSFTSVDAPAVDWTVPAGAGLATIWALAYDDQAGNILSRVHLSTVPNRIDFSGHVLADNSPAVPGAAVAINGVTAKTDSSGNFALFLTKEEPRYAVTITKSGYQMLSRIL